MGSGIFAFDPTPPPSPPNPAARAAEDAAIKAWMKKNKPRRFDTAATAHPMLLLEWLRSRGHVAVHVVRSRLWKVNGKCYSLREFLEFDDEERVRAGLPPLTARG